MRTHTIAVLISDESRTNKSQPKRVLRDAKLAVGDTIKLQIENSSPDIYGFDVDGAGNINRKNDHSGKPEKQVYTTNIPVKAKSSSPSSSRKSDTLYTKNDDNNIRLLAVGDNGLMSIREVAVVGRHGRFYLTTQVPHEFRCYLGRRGQVTAPHFDNDGEEWSQLVEFIEEVVDERDETHALLRVANASKNGRQLHAPQEDGRGVVLWFNHRLGFGVVLLDRHGKTKPVHFTDLPDKQGFPLLERGQIVRYSESGELVSADRKQEGVLAVK